MPAPNASPRTLIEVRIRSLQAYLSNHSCTAISVFIRPSPFSGVRGVRNASERKNRTRSEMNGVRWDRFVSGIECSRYATVTHRSQSTATISETSLTGRPTAVSTSSIVTKPALGTDAAPIEANVAVKLKIWCSSQPLLYLKNYALLLLFRDSKLAQQATAIWRCCAKYRVQGKS